MRIVTEPRVYLVGRSEIDHEAVQQFLDDENATWITDGDHGTELISELAGRLCYMSLGEKQGRKSNREYLMNIINLEHGSVLEHAVWNFIVTGVSRSFSHELIRHRAGWGYCLTGDTLIYSEHRWNGNRNGTNKRRLDYLHDMTRTHYGRSRLRLLRLRCLDEATGTFTAGRVRRIMCSGPRPVFHVELEDGKSITCSKEHRFLTGAGWKPLEEVVGGIQVSAGGVATWGCPDAEIMVNGAPAYKDPAWLKEQYITKNLDQRTIGAIAGVSHHTIRTWIRKHGLQKPPGSWTIGVEPWNKGKRYQAGWQYIEIFGRSPDEAGEAQRPRGGGHLLIPRPRRIKRIAYAGVQMTYDIHMEDPHHNFVANGIVTHNSQLSQRFVDESDTDFVEPDIIASDPELHAIWLESICKSHEAYCRLAEGLADKIERDYPHLKGRHKRKRAREAARSVLPNATETKIFMTANARALRHFVEYRGAPDAEPEIRKVAMQVLEIMQREAPNLFGDYQVEALPDGSTSAKTEHKKV